MFHDFPKDGHAVPEPATPADPTPPEAQPRWHQSRPARRGGLALLLAAVAGYGTYHYLDGSAAVADAPPPPTVTVAQPIAREVVQWDDYTGQFQASQAVEIKPRVSGQLVGIHFRDGDIVHRGQLLFTIDPRPFRAALAEAQARVAAARSALALAHSEYARAARLIDDEAVSQEEVDSLRAAVSSRAAEVAAAEAVVRQRALDVEFTQVRAPITGRVSDRRIDLGNLVAANESLLTTMLALDPIYFSFDGSEALYLKAMRARQQGRPNATDAEIRLQDETGYNWHGQVDFSDNAIDTGSGTLRGRAVVANPNYFLTPGMFGHMRLADDTPRATVLVPDAAVQTDQARRIVLIVERGGTVAVRPVELGARVGELRSIRSGLRPNDRVIIEGVQFARPGTHVNVRPGRMPAPGGAPAERAYDAPLPSQATLAR